MNEIHIILKYTPQYYNLKNMVLSIVNRSSEKKKTSVQQMPVSFFLCLSMTKRSKNSVHGQKVQLFIVPKNINDTIYLFREGKHNVLSDRKNLKEMS